MYARDWRFSKCHMFWTDVHWLPQVWRKRVLTVPPVSKNFLCEATVSYRLARFGSRLESRPARAACNSVFENVWVPPSWSPELCTSGSLLYLPSPPFRSSFETSLATLLLSEGVAGDSFCFVEGVRVLSDAHVLSLPEVVPYHLQYYMQTLHYSYGWVHPVFETVPYHCRTWT